MLGQLLDLQTDPEGTTQRTHLKTLYGDLCDCVRIRDPALQELVRRNLLAVHLPVDIK